MATEPKKDEAEDTGPEVLSLKITHREVQVWLPTVMIDGRQVKDLSRKDLLLFQKDVQEVYKTESKDSTFDEIELVRNIMRAPIIERDEDGKQIVNPQNGKVTAQPFEIEEQRSRNRILKAFEKLTKDEQIEKGKSITLKFHETSTTEGRLKYDDLVHLCEHMMLWCTDQTSLASYIAETHDKYMELKAAAEVEIDKKK